MRQAGLALDRVHGGPMGEAIPDGFILPIAASLSRGVRLIDQLIQGEPKTQKGLKDNCEQPTAT